MTPAPAQESDGEEGIVLLLVLVLVVVAISTAYAMGKTSLIEVLASRQSAQYARADLLARSGIGLAERALMDDLVEGTDITRSVESELDAWALLSRQEIELPGGALLRVRIRDAGNKIDINALVDAEGKRIGESSKNFLKAVFAHLRDTAPEFKGSSKLGDQEIDELSDALLDWLDKDEETRVGTPEPEYYVEIKHTKSAPLNRPVFSLDELADVPGMDPLLLEALKAYFTPYPMFPGGDGGGVNLNTAPAHVLALIYHGLADDQRMLNQRDVFEILKAREEGRVFCGTAGQEPCTTFSETVRLAEGELIFPPLTYTSRVFSIDVEASVGDTRACVHSVIDRGTGDPKTLYYELGLLMFERSIVGLDLGSWSLKLAELSASLRDAAFVRFAELPLPQAAPSEEVEATIQLWLQSRGLSPEVLVTALSTERLTQRHLRFPFAGAKRVSAAIGYEIDEELPVPISSVVSAHEQVLTRPDQTDVLVTLAARADVEQHLAACRRMELEPRIVESEGASLANLSRYLELSDVSRLILDVGHAKTNLCLLVDGRPIALRRIEIAGKHFTHALAYDLSLTPEAAQDHKHEQGIFERGSTKPISNGVRDLLGQLVREILRSVQSVVGDPLDPVSPTEILLVGGSARIAGLARFFEERTGLPTRVLEVSRDGGGAGEFSDAGPTVFAQAAALALRGASTERVTQTDFRQGELAYSPDLSGLRPQLRLTVGLFALFLALWVASAAARAWFASHRIDQLRGEVASILTQTFPDAQPGSDPLKTFETRAAETRALAAHLGVTGKGLSVLEILRQISALTPESLDISLDELSVERQSIVARGHSADFVSADQLKAELSKFEGFQRVLVTDVKTDPRRGGKTFTVSIRLGGEEDGQ